MRPYAECDTECYPDWWLFKVRLPDDRMYSIDMHKDKPLNYEAVRWFIENFTLLTFNGDNYDIPMISLAMSGADNHQLKQANDNIIKGGLKRWDFYKAYGVDTPRGLDHIDIMEVAPGVRVGLKTYMGRMHSKRLQDLPYSPDEPTTPPMRADLDLYCGNDLDGNRGLLTVCKERLDLRIALGERYGVDLRSKSDAQCAEAIVKARLGYIPEKRIVPHGWRFKYVPPNYVRFSTPTLQAALQTILASEFVVNDIDQLRSHPGEEIIDADGKKIKTGLLMPDALKKLVITIGATSYKLGIGGLHSQESAVQYHTVERRCTLRMDDVASYYPSLILNLNITPAQLGPRFQEIYRETYEQRLTAKARSKEGSEHKTMADGLKIVLNGTFGKLGSKYSIFYAPELLIQVTLTGQLCLLMLIESLELNGARVVSANTDGIVTLCPAGREWLRDQCIAYWSGITGLVMESAVLRSLYARDVNSYVAIEPDGKHKGKGAFAESGVLNNVHPDKDIVCDAVIKYLKDGTPLDNTIRACNDIRKFLVIRSVKGGGVYPHLPFTVAGGADMQYDIAPVDEYLGKTVRWYYAQGEERAIHYATNNNKVAGSTGARPCMTLPDAFPADVDYTRYHDEAVKMLGTLGLSYAA